MNRVATAMQLLQGLPPEVIQTFVKWPVVLNKAFQGLGLTDATRSDAEAQQIQAAQQQQQMAQQMAPIAAQAVADQAAAGTAP